MTLVPAPDRLSVLHPTTGSSPRLKKAPAPRSFVTKPENHLQWLMTALPTIEELTESLADYIGRNGQTPRHFAAAQQVAAELLSAGRSRPWVQQYLSVFGFQNSKDLVGRVAGQASG